MINKKHTRKYDYYLDMYDIFGRFNMFDVYFARINTEIFLKNVERKRFINLEFCVHKIVFEK